MALSYMLEFNDITGCVDQKRGERRPKNMTKLLDSLIVLYQASCLESDFL